MPPLRPWILAFLLGNKRKTECGAKLFPICMAVRAAPFALWRNKRKTECGAKQFPTGSAVRAAPFALWRNKRKTECGAIRSCLRLAVRAAPFALLTFSPGFERAATIRVPAWIEDAPAPAGRVRFEATLNGAPAAVSAQFGPSSDQVILIVLDLAGDVSFVDPARQALIDEIGKLPPNAWAGLLRAQDGLHVLADPGPDRAPVVQAIRDLAASGRSGLLDTVEQTLALGDAMMRKSSARVSVLYVTDSSVYNYRDDYTNPVINQSDPHDLSRRFPEQLIVEKIDKLVEGIDSLQPPLFVVHLHYRGSRLNEAYQSGLKTLTGATGGDSEICRSIAEIPTAISAMFARISSAWSLSLTLPARPHADLRIHVSAFSGDQELHLSARSRITVKRK